MADNDAENQAGDVISRTLQDLRAEYGDYDVLKLDIEEMENDAIRSDIDYIRFQFWFFLLFRFGASIAHRPFFASTGGIEANRS